MGYTTLEDFFGDIVGKASRGQSIDSSLLAQKTGLTTGQIGQIGAYDFIPDDETIHTLANVLGLNGEKLVGIAKGWLPDLPNEAFENDVLKVERLILDAGMTVNCYVLVCKTTGKGALIDPGGQAQVIKAALSKMGVDITHILLTHGHGDHVGALDEMAKETGALVCGCERDFGLMGGRSRLVTEKVDEGWQTVVGNLTLDTFDLSGHTPGGIGYYTRGVLFSGDALFAGSLGGARGDAYHNQIRAVSQKALSLPDETRIFPGHGPITTVAQEKAHNPYFT